MTLLTTLRLQGNVGCSVSGTCGLRSDERGNRDTPWHHPPGHYKSDKSAKICPDCPTYPLTCVQGPVITFAQLVHLRLSSIVTIANPSKGGDAKLWVYRPAKRAG